MNKNKAISPTKYFKQRKKYLFKKYNIKQGQQQKRKRCAPISDVLQAVVDICNYTDYSILVKDFLPLLSRKLKQVKASIAREVRSNKRGCDVFDLMYKYNAVVEMIEKMKNFTFGTTFEREVVNARMSSEYLSGIIYLAFEALDCMNYAQLSEMLKRAKKMRLDIRSKPTSKEWELRALVKEHVENMTYSRILSLVDLWGPFVDENDLNRVLNLAENIKQANTFLNDFMAPLLKMPNVEINSNVNFFEEHQI